MSVAVHPGYHGKHRIGHYTRVTIRMVPCRGARMGEDLDLLRQEINRQGRPVRSPQGNMVGAVAHRGSLGGMAVLRLCSQRQGGKQQCERCEQ